LKQEWAGGLKDIKLTSMDLQKLSLDWRQKKGLLLIQTSGLLANVNYFSPI